MLQDNRKDPLQRKKFKRERTNRRKLFKSLTSGDGAWTSKWLSGHDKIWISGDGIWGKTLFFIFKGRGKRINIHSQKTY
jgi:hypothetical protein